MSQHHTLHVKKQSAHIPSCLSQWRRYHSKQKMIIHTTHRTDEYFGSGNSLVSSILHFKCVQVHWSLTDKKTDFNWFVFVQDVLCATILPPLTKLASLYGHDTALLPLSRSLYLYLCLSQTSTYILLPPLNLNDWLPRKPSITPTQRQRTPQPCIGFISHTLYLEP